jgi:hypothetical protein
LETLFIFWGFQIVAFAALALSVNRGSVNAPLVLIVSVLGALAAWTGVLTARGSKFWQANWEAHVDFLEPEVEGKLHVTALVAKRLEYSVSRVNERFLQVVFSGWIVVYAAGAAVLIWPDLLKLLPAHAVVLQIGLPAIAFAMGMWRLMHNTKSNLRGRAFMCKTMQELDDS